MGALSQLESCSGRCAGAEGSGAVWVQPQLLLNAWLELHRHPNAGLENEPGLSKAQSHIPPSLSAGSLHLCAVTGTWLHSGNSARRRDSHDYFFFFF